MKRKLAAILLLALMLVLAGCGGEPAAVVSSSAYSAPAGASSPAGRFSLPFNATDSLNPYLAKSKVNQELSLLIYEPLVRLNANFQPDYCLAESITVNGKNVVVNLKNVLFNDGSRLDAEDVTASIKAAKDSQSKYKDQLDNIASYSPAAADRVSITLKNADAFAINMLEFPIIKRGSTARVNSDKKPLPPYGCGRYLFDETAGNILTANAQYFEGAPSISEISLVDTPDEPSLKHAVEVGLVSMYYTEAGMSILKGKNTTVPQNNIIYLGLNFNNTYLKSEEFRQALSLMINRDKICSEAYSGNARPAVSPYNPAMPTDGLTTEQTLSTAPEQEKIVATMNSLGYNRKDDSGYLLNGSRQISLRLLVNTDNASRDLMADTIVQNLKDSGINVSLVKKSMSAYKSALSSGDYDMYLAEVKLNNNHDFSALLPGGSLSFRLPDITAASSAASTAASKPASSKPASSSNQAYSGASSQAPSSTAASKPDPVKQSLGELMAAFNSLKSLQNPGSFAAAFNKSLPFIPLVYRCGSLNYTAAVQGEWVAGPGDIFYGICDLTI